MVKRPFASASSRVRIAPHLPGVHLRFNPRCQFMQLELFPRGREPLKLERLGYVSTAPNSKAFTLSRISFGAQKMTGIDRFRRVPSPLAQFVAIISWHMMSSRIRSAILGRRCSASLPSGNDRTSCPLSANHPHNLRWRDCSSTIHDVASRRVRSIILGCLLSKRVSYVFVLAAAFCSVSRPTSHLAHLPINCPASLFPSRWA